MLRKQERKAEQRMRSLPARLDEIAPRVSFPPKTQPQALLGPAMVWCGVVPGWSLGRVCLESSHVGVLGRAGIV
jgi:hypothetical protein